MLSNGNKRYKDLKSLLKPANLSDLKYAIYKTLRNVIWYFLKKNKLKRHSIFGIYCKVGTKKVKTKTLFVNL